MDKKYPKSIASKQYVTVSICLGPHVTVNGIMTYTMDMTVAITVTITITVTVGVCLGRHVVVIGITSNDYHDNLILQRIIITNKYYSCPIIAVQSE